MTYQTVALYNLADGRFSGVIGRFGDSSSAHAHAKRYLAGIGSAAIDTVREGKVELHFRSRPQQTRPLDSLVCVGYMMPTGTDSHYLDDLVAVVVPPSLLSTDLAMHMACATFNFTEALAA